VIDYYSSRSAGIGIHCVPWVRQLNLNDKHKHTDANISERRSATPISVNFAGFVNPSASFETENDNQFCRGYENSTSSHSNRAMVSLKSSVGEPENPTTPLATEKKMIYTMNDVPSTPPLSDPNPVIPPPPPPSPVDFQSPARAGISKLSRSIDRPVEEKPLLDEIREVLAQSFLMFLLADLRHMSATGRISTKYESLAVDSDICKRDTAKHIACLSDNVRDDEDQQIGHFKGLSPAVIMAIVILEIRDTAVKTAEEKKNAVKNGGKKKHRYATSVDIDNDDQFVGYAHNSKKKKLTEESMESLMRCYSRMVSEDLMTEIPNVRRRRQTFHQNNFGQSGSLHSPSILSSSKRQPFPSPIKARMARHTSAPVNTTMSSATSTLPAVHENAIVSEGFEVQQRREAASEVSNTDEKDLTVSVITDIAATEIQNSNKESSNSTVSFADEQQNIGASRMSLFSPGKWNRERTTSEDATQRRPLMPQQSFRERIKMTQENSRQIADQIKTNLNQQVDNLLPSNHEANTRKEFQELTDVFFDQGANEDLKASLGATYSRTEMVEVIREGIATRDKSRLEFMGKLFKAGTISKLMADSHARIVWVNDWYPMKDLTYAISVDALQKRVMVVFRGAITTTDWKKALEFTFHKIRNPVKENFEGKKRTLRVFAGLYTYLFRLRKDTGTTKYDEIANMVHKYGTSQIGPDYKLIVTGHSLGGALTNFFAFYASTDDRFTMNGPVKAIAFASPYMGGHSWADSIRHQERRKKLQLVQVRNSSDVIPRIPGNFAIGRRGPLWRHVGIGVTLPMIPRLGFKWKPLVHYWGKEKSCLDSTIHGYRRNIIFHIPYWRPWYVDRAHTLFELQDRLIYGELHSETGGGFLLLQSTLDELYEKLEENDFQTFSKTKWWGLHRNRERQTNAAMVK